MTDYDDTSALGQKGLKRLIQLIKNALSQKQDSLQSGSNIKTVNGESLVGSGNVQVGEGLTYALSKSGHVISLTDSGGGSTTVQDGYVATSLSYAQLTRQLALNGMGSSVTFPLASASVPGLMSQTDKRKADIILLSDVPGVFAIRPEGNNVNGNQHRVILTEYGNLRYDEYVNGEWKAVDYFEKDIRPGDEISLDGVDLIGYVTSGGSTVRVTIPLAEHIDSSVSNIELTNTDGSTPATAGYIFRQNGRYVYGSDASTPFGTGVSETCRSVAGGHAVGVEMTVDNTTNATNNDTIGINFVNMKLSFS